MLQPMESFRCCDNLSKNYPAPREKLAKVLHFNFPTPKTKILQPKTNHLARCAPVVIRAARRVCTDVTLSPYKLYQSAFFVCVGWVLSRNLTPGDTSKNIIGRKRFGFFTAQFATSRTIREGRFWSSVCTQRTYCLNFDL